MSPFPLLTAVRGRLFTTLEAMLRLGAFQGPVSDYLDLNSSYDSVQLRSEEVSDSAMV